MLKECFVFGMGMFCGAGRTLTGKVLYGLDSVGVDGVLKKFEMPLFQTLVMFFAMTLALPIHWAYNVYVHRHYHTQKLQGKPIKADKPPSIPMRVYLLLIFPAVFDLMATFFANLGLLSVTVSVFQLLKSMVIVFVAFIKIFYYKETLQNYMWIGIACNLIAISLVSVTSLFDTEQSNGSEGGHVAYGILMVIFSCFVQALQYIFEERIMEDASAPPLIVIGMEGFWGLVITIFIVYPLSILMNSSETFIDAWTMLMNSATAQVVTVIFVFMVLGLNVFAILTTFLLDSIFHAILDSFRPPTVWWMDLLLFYVLSHGRFGEAWTSASWLQLIGMVLLIVGTLIYNGTIRLCGIKYEDLPQVTKTPILYTPSNKTPHRGLILIKSPLIARSAIDFAEKLDETLDEVDRARLRAEYMTEYHTHEKQDGFKGPKVGTSYGSLV